jgi:uncharacterized protein YndB with AHSA1/START domain
VHLTASLDAPCSPADLFGWVQDLERYPQWLTIVTHVEPRADGAWLVDLRGHLGPLARSKRLRMVRASFEPSRRVVFEREEGDGRRHSPWALRAEVTAVAAGSHLEMHLDYGGGMWGPVLERLLADEIEAARHRLLALVSGPTR